MINLKNLNKQYYFKIVLLIFLSNISNYSLAQTSKNVLETTKSIADKIIRETSFDYDTRALWNNGRWSHVKLPSFDNGKQYLVSAVLDSKINGEILLGLAFKGNIEIYLNGESIFSGQSKTLNLSEYTYGRYHIQEEIKIKVKKGKNLILIQCLGTDDDSTIMVMPANREGGKNHLVNFASQITVPYASQWLIKELKTKDLISENLIKITTKNYFNTDIVDRFKGWSTPSLPIVQALKKPNGTSFGGDSYANWHYANGGTMLGVLNLSDVSKDESYHDFVEKHANNILNNKEYFNWEYNQLPALAGAFSRLFRNVMLDDSGGPALYLTALKLDNNTNKYDDLINPALVQILEKQNRLSDGTLCRPEPENNTIWADDLFMAIPFLCRTAIATNNDALFDEVAKQIIQFNNYLEDKTTGLYFHGWYDDKKENTPVRWGRANGWVTWAMSEALLLMPKNHKDYKTIQKIYSNHITSIAKFQDDSGMWHQVIDHPETFEETSCTAMFTMSLARGVKNDWLDKKYTENILNGWNALEEKVQKDGTVIGICQGTSIGTSIEFYNKRKTPNHDPRGLGAILTAGAEVYKLLEFTVK